MRSTAPWPGIRNARSDRRRLGMLLAAALLAGSVATFVAPAQSASALAIDCSYDFGLSIFIGTGRDGLTCMGGGTRTPDTVYGSGHQPGQSVPGGVSVGSSCSYATPGMPDRFYAWGAVQASTESWDSTDDDGTKSRTTATSYSRGGRNVGIRIIRTKPGAALQMTFKDYTLLNANGIGIVLGLEFNCKTDADWVATTPWVHGDTSSELAGTPAPTPATSHTLVTQARMTPVPFHSGQYFLRVDLVDNHPVGTSTGAMFDLNLESYSLSSIVQAPTQSSCPSALPYGELCLTPEIAAGERQTFLFVVAQRAGVAGQSPLAITTYHEGHHKTGVVNVAGTEISFTSVVPE